MKRKHSKAVNVKRHSSECFNAEMKSETKTALNEFILDTHLSVEQLQEELKTNYAAQLQQKWAESHDKEQVGLELYMSCLQFCVKELDNELQRIGWKSNRTGYIAFESASTTDLLLHGVIECVIIAKKQLLRYLE